MRKVFFLLATCCMAVAAHSQSWSLTGNAGTNPSLHFVGTTDNNPLRFRVNNTHAGEVNGTTGNTSLGFGAGAAKTSFSNVAIGIMALNGNTGQANSAVGAYTLTFNTGTFNIAHGYAALYHNAGGSANTAMGYNALTNNTNGTDNVGIGREALRTNSGNYSSRNTAVGSYALYKVQDAQYNTAIGYAAGDSYFLGYNNTILGANCDGSFDGQYNIVAVGQGVICPDNSTARIGNSATWSIGGYAGWTNFSDGRYKKDVQENVRGLDFIMKLRPVTYHLDITGASRQAKENGGKDWDDQMKKAIAEKENMVFSGFVAQEVEKAAAAAGYDFSGVDKPRNEHGFYGLRYADFVVPLVKGMQEQQQVIDELKNQNAILLQQNAELEKRMASLEKRLGTTNNYNALTVRPNPSAGKAVLDIVAASPSRALIRIFDSKGALVKQLQSGIAQGDNQLMLDMQQFAAGTYHVTAEWDNGQVKKTVQVIKE